MEFLADLQIRIIFQLFLSVLLGGLIGLEREYRRKAAGLRTHSLICLGAALFTIISLESFNIWLGKTGIVFDPSRIIASVIMGVGFIGTGLIVFHHLKLEGLTTAAGIWVVAAVGVAVGVQFYLVAVFTALLTLTILTGLRILEEKFLRKETE